MDRSVVPRNQRNACAFDRRVGIRLLVALICCGLTVAAQNSTQQTASKPFSIRTTHLLGFENAKSNCSGTLSIQDDFLQFQQSGKSGAQIKIGSVRDIFLGEESRQVGGVPMSLGNAATAKRRSRLARGQRYAAPLPALFAQENNPNRTDLYLCPRFRGLLKLQEIVLDG